MPVDVNSLNLERRILSATTRSDQFLELFENVSGNISVYIDGNYQLGVSYDGDEPSYGDETHAAYLNILRMLNRDLSKDRILILGGGDLGLACLLVDNGALKITEFELDRQLVEILAEYFSFTKKGVNDDRINIEYGDGFNLLNSCEENSFDIVIGDLTDKAGVRMGEADVHEDLIRACAPDGIVMTHSCSNKLDLNMSFASFHRESSPDFFCIIDADPDSRLVWSTKMVRGVDYVKSR